MEKITAQGQPRQKKVGKTPSQQKKAGSDGRRLSPHTPTMMGSLKQDRGPGWPRQKVRPYVQKGLGLWLKQ
jgi:hypothetical protein